MYRTVPRAHGRQWSILQWICVPLSKGKLFHICVSAVSGVAFEEATEQRAAAREALSGGMSGVAEVAVAPCAATEGTSGCPWLSAPFFCPALSTVQHTVDSIVLQ